MREPSIKLSAGKMARDAAFPFRMPTLLGRLASEANNVKILYDDKNARDRHCIVRL